MNFKGAHTCDLRFRDMNMKKEFIYKDIEELITPVGSFTIQFGSSRIRFSVKRNTFDLPYNIYDENQNSIGCIQTETNYQIVIDKSLLEIGKEYTIRFSSGKWEYCDSDEHTVCFNTVIDDWVVGIGSYDPCDSQKEEQAFDYSERMGFLKRKRIQVPSEYDESKFSNFTTEQLESCNGFSFKIYDQSEFSVWFNVAWIRIEKYPKIEYEGAIGFWLT